MYPFRQKQIVDLIKKEGLNLVDFDFNPISNDEFEIHFKPIENIVFRKHKSHNGHYYFSPNIGGYTNNVFKYTGFDSLLENFALWIKAVKENVEIGNPWADLEDMKEAMGNIDFNSYEVMLNVKEQKIIEKGLGLLVQQFETLQIDVSQIKDDIEHLKEMTSEISRKDWIMLFLGYVTTWVFTNIITSKNSQSVWEFVKSLFRDLNFTNLIP